ncbi:hypothetical protein RDI58_004008 [Solanum bulbocastanum]|uniref:Uncharacterized protein n=1 Tax=Solanum bulbocastanum TaxID=147425 RepID=A0AAN8U5Q4_SOLBU
MCWEILASFVELAEFTQHVAKCPPRRLTVSLMKRSRCYLWKAKGVVIASEVETPQTTHLKPPDMSGKGKNQVVDDTSSDHSMEITSIQFTSSASKKNEEVVGSGTPVHTPMPKAELTNRNRSELHSKAAHDPLALAPAP